MIYETCPSECAATNHPGKEHEACVISDEAVEAAARWLWERDSHDIVEGPRPRWEDLAASGIVWKASLADTRQEARELLEAAAPFLLSHERQLTADAHRDAIVNRDTADRLERELGPAKAEAWHEGMEAMYESTSHEWPPIPESNPYRRQA